MSEHEILKEICDTIGYDYSKRYNFYKTLKKFGVNLTGKSGRREASIQEIIFTQEFVDKLLDYRSIMQEDKKIIGTKKHQDWQDCFNNILDNLDDPVTYLYNLLGLGEKY